MAKVRQGYSTVQKGKIMYDWGFNLFEIQR